MIEFQWKADIARRFGSAAQDYEAHSPVQRQAAEELVDRIAKAKPAGEVRRVLEIGCGTGYLTRTLFPRYPRAAWQVTDIAGEMVDLCQNRLLAEQGPESRDRVSFSVMDGEHPDCAGSFDLIVSNLSFQWFHDLPGSLARLAALLAPGGLLAFSTLGPKTFDLWHRCQAELGIERLGPDFPDLSEYPGFLPGLNVEVSVLPIVQRHKNALGFLHALRGIGAHAPGLGRAPLAPGKLRKLLKNYESHFTAGAVEADYEVVFVLCSKSGKA